MVDFELVSEYRESAEMTLSTAVVARHLSLLSPVEVVDGVGVVQDIHILLDSRHDPLTRTLLVLHLLLCSPNGSVPGLSKDCPGFQIIKENFTAVSE